MSAWDTLDIFRGRGQVRFRHAVRIEIGRMLAARESFYMSLAWGLGVALVNFFSSPQQYRVSNSVFSVLFAFAIGYLSTTPWRVRLHRGAPVSFLRIAATNGLLAMVFGYVTVFILFLVAGFVTQGPSSFVAPALQFYARNAFWGFIFAPIGIAIVMGEDGARRERRLTARGKRLQRLAETARIVALRAQINPHFFFNSLNVIAALIPQRPDDAERAVLLLAEALRPVLMREQPLTATLEQELHVASAYMQIEQLRLGDRIAFTIDVPAELMATELPSLTLQPLVENAVRHGAARCSEPYRIAVRARREAKAVIIEVRNEPVALPLTVEAGLQQASRISGHALKNIETRLHAHMGKDSRLDVLVDSGPRAVARIVIGQTDTRVVAS